MNVSDPRSWPSFQLCAELNVLPENAGSRIWQQKYDGVRALVSSQALKLRTTGYQGHRLCFEDGSAVPPDTLLDGEILSRSTRFYHVVPALMAEEWDKVYFVPFDLLATPAEPQLFRARLAERLLALTRDFGQVQAPYFALPGQPMPDVPADWEGVIGKNLELPYRPGRLGWVKWKFWDTLEAFVLNVEEGRNSWQGSVGKVVFGLISPRTGELIEAGKAGGLDTYQRELYWEHPELVIGKRCEIKHYGLNKGKLRNPIFLGLKEV